MAWSISHELADFLEYAARLLQRLKTEGSYLSQSEIRIFREQLKQLNRAAEPLDDNKSQKLKEVGERSQPSYAARNRSKSI